MVIKDSSQFKGGNSVQNVIRAFIFMLLSEILMTNIKRKTQEITTADPNKRNVTELI